MADFSVGQAMGSGFSLALRKPLTVLIWGLFIWVTAILPVGLVMANLVTQIPHIAQETAANTLEQKNQAIAAGANNTAEPATADRSRPPSELPPATMAMMSQILLIQPLALLASLAIRGVLGSAVCRAVLEPEDSAFAYLRLGLREVWVLLTYFVSSIILGFAIVALMIPLGVIGGVSIYFLREQPVGIGVVIGLIYLVFVVFAVWLSLRMVMAIPMSFDQNAFRLFESWNFTRGHVWKMAGLVLLQILVAILIEVVIVGVVVGVALAMGAGAMRPEQWQAWAQSLAAPNGWQAQAIALAALGSLVLALFSGFMFAVFMAPWADAYRQLRDSGAGSAAPYSPSLGEARPAT